MLRREEPPSAALDLKLLSSSPPATAAEYQSVCTLEKVKSALERAERESRRKQQQQQQQQRQHPHRSDGSGSPTSSSTTTSSAKRQRKEEEVEGESRSSSSSSLVAVVEEQDAAAGGVAAAGCPSCLLYVLISRSNPRCPRCGSAVPLPPADKKKPWLDLNASTTLTPTAATTTTPTTVKYF